MKNPKSPNGKAYAAVSLLAARGGCAAVKVLENKKILAVNAPRLPLPECSMPDKCRCRYQKYTDRRDEDENRRFQFSSERSAWYSGEQRRKTRGRRTKD